MLKANCWIRNGSAILKSWQLRDVPSSTNGIDEECASIHPTPLDINFVSLVREGNRLCGNYLEIVVYPSLVNFD